MDSCLQRPPGEYWRPNWAVYGCRLSFFLLVCIFTRKAVSLLWFKLVRCLLGLPISTSLNKKPEYLDAVNKFLPQNINFINLFFFVQKVRFTFDYINPGSCMFINFFLVPKIKIPNLLALWSHYSELTPKQSVHN